MAASFLGFIIAFFSAGSSTDILSLLDPQMALECLGEKTDDAHLRALIEGKGGEAAAGSELDTKAAKTAIQNLASASAGVRESARKKLIELGQAVRPLLESVVETDPKRAEEAKKILTELGAAAKATAYRQEVSRFLAVRLAADRGLKDSAPAIRELEKSADSLLARAAAEAAAKLEGKPLPAPAERPWVSSLGFLEALPKETRFAMDAPTGLGKGGPTSVSDFLKGMFSSMGGGGAEADQMARMATQEIANMAVKFGNFRIDRVALANVGGVGPSGGGLGIFLLGEYHRDVLERGLAAEASTWTVEEVEGYKLFKSREVRLVALDDHAVLLLPDEGSVNFPVPEYLKALKAGAKPLRGEKRWDQFLGTLGGKAFLRGLAVTDETLMSEFYREIDGEGSVPQPVKDALKGMGEIEADIREAEGSKLAYRTEAVFGSAEQATAMADFVKQGIQMGIQEIEGNIGDLAGSPMEAMAKQVVDILKGIRVVADGKKGILRGEADPSILTRGFGGFFGIGGMR